MLSKHPEGTPIKKKALDAAMDVLRNEYDIDCICSDILDTASEQYVKDNFNDVVNSLINETFYWEKGEGNY